MKKMQITNVHAQKDKTYLWHPWSPLNAVSSRLTLSRGEDYRVWDSKGKEYIDCSSLNLTCGYTHKAIIDAISVQLGTLHGADLSSLHHELAEILAKRLAKYLPTGLSKTLFVNSGSEGFEAAVFIAASYWTNIGKPRFRIVTFSRGYHGSTFISRSLSGLREVKHPLNLQLEIMRVQLPMEPRKLRHPESLDQILIAFEKAFKENQEVLPMCVIVEPLLNVGGGIILPPGFLNGLRKLCDATGSLLILDEVFTGYGRTGKLFAFQHEGISPDILVSSKGLASGYMPITAVTVQEFIHDTFEKDDVIGGIRVGHTTSGHAVSCAAALATLDIIESEKLLDRAQEYGVILLKNFESYIGSNSIIDVRGLGMVIVIEMESEMAANRLRIKAESHGLLLRQNNEVLMVVPPLIIDMEGLKQVIKRLDSCLSIKNHGMVL